MMIQVSIGSQPPRDGRCDAVCPDDELRTERFVLVLGAGVDADPDGQPDAAAEGDDVARSDDEDGVTSISPLIPGLTATLGR